MFGALAFTFIYSPINSCGGECGPQAPQAFHHLETVGLPLLRHCPCNESLVLRTEPNPRTLSNEVFAQATSIPDERGLSSMVMLIGQFLDHDIVLTSSNKEDPPIVVPVEQPDPFFPPTLTQLNVTRSNLVLDGGDCPVQVSDCTPVVDLSMVYGNSDGELALLREHVGGRLRVGEGGLLPPVSGEDPTLLVGDPRATAWAGLVAMHTVWVRNHNYWARRLQHVYPLWSEEELFWKARQLNIAEWQFIVYNEYLAALLGSQYGTLDMEGAALDLSLTPVVGSEFSVVAFRIGHSQIPNTFGSDEVPLSQIFGPLGVIYVKENGVEAILERVIKTPSEKVDVKFVNGIRNLLFGQLGLDLSVLNIVRAREMRIQDFGSLRNCFRGPGLPEDKSDPLHGLFAEEHVTGSSLGRTAGLIIARQFKLLRDSNFGFYLFKKDNIGTSFYGEILDITLRRVILRNTKLTFVDLPQNNVFFTT